MKNDYEKAVDTLMKDVKDLRGDMKDILGAIPGKAKDCLETAKVSVHDCVVRRPYISLLVALGAGAILGGLLRWGRR